MISKLSEHLKQDVSGLYIPVNQKGESISYPEEGHETCFQVEDKSFWFQHRNRCLLSLLQRFNIAGDLLDVGGGNGFVTKMLVDSGYNAALLEPERKGALNGMLKRNLPEVINATLADAAFPETSIDAILCLDVIEHIQNPAHFLGDIHRVLKNKGCLIVTVPALQWLWSGKDIEAGHFRRYNKKVLMEESAELFDIEYFSYFFQILTAPLFLMAALPYKIGLFRKGSAISTSTEHGTNSNFITKIFNWFLNREHKKISCGKTLPFGTSCLALLRKKP